MFSHNPSFAIIPKEHYDFYCPICGHDLTMSGKDNFASVIMQKNDEKMYVVFSKIKGELCTYKVLDSKILETFGEHANNHIDFISASLLK